MSVLQAQNRDSNLKGKQLRREGVIPGVIFGKHLKESISIKFLLSDVEQFLKSNAVGSKVEVEIDGQKIMALLMEVTHTPVVNKIEHLSFQALTAGEKVTSTAQIFLLNKESIQDIIQQLLHEISYKALPTNLVDKIDVDLKGMKIGDSVFVSDLEITKNKDIEVLTSPDSLVVSIIAHKVVVEETPAVE